VINYEKGFTLIELLVVTGIIGLLSTIVLVSVGHVRAEAKGMRREPKTLPR
jgi:prepilin-type N-terminal cleavage/methylation domain-containing protein